MAERAREREYLLPSYYTQPGPLLQDAGRSFGATASRAPCGVDGRVMLFFLRHPQGAQQPHSECRRHSQAQPHLPVAKDIPANG